MKPLDTTITSLINTIYKMENFSVLVLKNAHKATLDDLSLCKCREFTPSIMDTMPTTCRTSFSDSIRSKFFFSNRSYNSIVEAAVVVLRLVVGLLRVVQVRLIVVVVLVGGGVVAVV